MKVRLQVDINHAHIAEVLGVRPEVLAFALQMERKLKANDHKGKTGWKDGSPFSTRENLKHKLEEEFHELRDAVLEQKYATHPTSVITPTEANQNVMDEAADLANICMMLADNYGGGLV